MSEYEKNNQPESVICPNCGGEYAAWSLKCPYCGSVNDAGAEQTYMEHMEELRRNLDNVDEASDEIYRDSVGGTMKWLLRIVTVVLVLSVAAMVCIRVTKSHAVKKHEQMALDQAAWEVDEFPKLDAWYEAGDYQAILDEYYDVLLNTEYNIYDWPHANFITNYYSAYAYIREAKEMMDGASETMSEFYLGESIHGVLSLLYETTDERLESQRESYRYNGMHGLMDEEIDMVREYQVEAREFLHENLGWTDEHAQEVYEELADKEGYLSISKCFDYAKKLKKQAK